MQQRGQNYISPQQLESITSQGDEDFYKATETQATQHLQTYGNTSNLGGRQPEPSQVGDNSANVTPLLKMSGPPKLSVSKE